MLPNDLKALEFDFTMKHVVVAKLSFITLYINISAYWLSLVQKIRLELTFYPQNAKINSRENK